MNKSLWHSDLFRAACVSLALHAGAAGVAVLSFSIASPRFFLAAEPPQVLHVSWISEESPPREPVRGIRKTAALHSTEASPAPARNREKEGQERTARPEIQMLSLISLNLPAAAGTSDVGPAEGMRASTGTPLPGAAIGDVRSAPLTLAAPRYAENDHPVYPALARQRGHEGVVLLSAEVSADGRVGSLRVKRSSGHASLDRSALEAVKRWKFRPGRSMGKPVAMWVDVPVKFVLREDDSLS